MIRRNALEKCAGSAPSLPPCVHSGAKRLLAATVVIVLLAALATEPLSQTTSAAKAPTPSLRAADVFALQQRCGAADAVEDSYQLTCKHACGGPELGTADVLAFEENRFFIYIVSEASAVCGTSQEGRRAEDVPRLVRRFIFLKPATFVVEDRVCAPASKGPARWLLRTGGEPEVTGRRVRVAEREGELLCETLLPEEATLKSIRQVAGGQQPAGHCVEVALPGDAAEVRFLHVLHARSRGNESSAARPELTEKDGRLRLTVSADERVFRLTLSPGGVGADEIAVANAGGETLLKQRLLPAGILPHGPQGTRLLERWDSAYRGGRRPGWDTGRPSSNLKKAVEDGTLRPCRAVVLGCGSGTNAVYLAGKGFDVTGIDIAPTALTQAAEKARQSGVEVRWLVADVLSPPRLEPFELIFDRGCYHGVRRQNAAGYVEAVRRLSRPGTRLLILAGNANESRQYGPPRVKEEEFLGDFSKSFDFEWLRETRFDTRDPAGEGALAWSALLRRKQEP